MVTSWGTVGFPQKSQCSDGTIEVLHPKHRFGRSSLQGGQDARCGGGPPDIANGKGTPARITLFIDGDAVGGGDLPVTIPIQPGLGSSVTLGNDNGSPVMEASDYAPPFAFTGTIRKALVDVTGEPFEDKEEAIKAYLKAAMARQ